MKKVLSMVMVVATILTMSVGVLAAEVVEPGVGSSEVTLTVEPTTFSVTVPMSLPVDVSATGEVTVAQNAKITNNSYGAVKVTNVVIDPLDWTIVPFSTDMTKEKVGSKKLGFELNNGVTSTGNSLGFDPLNYPKLDGKNPTDSDQLALTYDAVVPAQSAGINSDVIANIVFTIGWDE